MRPSNKDKIIAAVLKRFPEVGDAFTLEDVMRWCKISKGGIFYHFPSRAHLALEVAWKYIEQTNTLDATLGVLSRADIAALHITANGPGFFDKLRALQAKKGK